MNTRRQALIQWLNHLSEKPSYAMSLTMKHVERNTFSNRLRCQKNMRYFLNVLNQSLFGNSYRRHKKRVEVIPSLEVSPWMRLHYHLLIVKPDHISNDAFAVLLDTTWHKTNLANTEKKIEKVYSDGWIAYITKHSNDDDTIDYENLHIDR